MRTLLCVATLVFVAGPVWAQASVPLFVIERSVNKNVVHYDARLTSDGKLDPKEPVIAYWIMLAEDGHREDLNWLERTKAYGFSIQPDSRPGTYRMTLMAYPERPITVYQDGSGPKAAVEIAGRRAILQKVYIAATETLGVPKVQYIELFGRDLRTQELLSERIMAR